MNKTEILVGALKKIVNVRGIENTPAGKIASDALTNWGKSAPASPVEEKRDKASDRDFKDASAMAYLSPQYCFDAPTSDAFIEGYLCGMANSREELANANIRIKELQDWHDSHL